jgi:hypothetical protein
MPVDAGIPWPAHRHPAVNAGFAHQVNRKTIRSSTADACIGRPGDTGGGIDTLYESLAGGGSSGASKRVWFDYTRQLFAKQAK